MATKLMPLWHVVSDPLGQSDHTRSMTVVAESEEKAIQLWREYCCNETVPVTATRIKVVVTEDKSSFPQFMDELEVEIARNLPNTDRKRTA